MEGWILNCVVVDNVASVNKFNIYIISNIPKTNNLNYYIVSHTTFFIYV